jgi:hypothetical protein
MASGAKGRASWSCVEAIDLDLDRAQVAHGRACALQRRCNAALRRDVVVLDEDRVVEAEPVIDAAAQTHGAFLQRAETRRRLARAGDLRASCRPSRRRTST